MDQAEIPDELAGLAKSDPVKTVLVSADLRKMAAAFANPATREQAETTLQQWAEGAPSLRKAFAAAWLARARGTISGAAAKVGRVERSFSDTHPMASRLATTAIAGGASVGVLRASKGRSHHEKDPMAKLAGGELQKAFVSGWLRRGALAAKSKLRGGANKVTPAAAPKPEQTGWKTSEKVSVGTAALGLGAGAAALAWHANRTQQDPALGKGFGAVALGAFGRASRFVAAHPYTTSALAAGAISSATGTAMNVRMSPTRMADGSIGFRPSYSGAPAASTDDDDKKKKKCPTCGATTPAPVTPPGTTS